MRPRRYKVVLVGVEPPTAAGRTRRPAPLRAISWLRAAAWQYQLAAVCFALGSLILFIFVR